MQTDWRLDGKDDCFVSRIFKKIVFPNFWSHSYESKNDFYELVQMEANRFVDSNDFATEYLEGDKIKFFWHEHCSFCWTKITADKKGVFYSTPDYKDWICEECFYDFQKRFNWLVEE